MLPKWADEGEPARLASLIISSSGDFVIQIGQALGSLGLGSIIGAWLQAKLGRKVRLKVGEIEGEAQTVEELEKLLKQAEEIQSRNQPKGDP